MKVTIINFEPGKYPPKELTREEIEVPEPPRTLEERVKVIENQLGINPG